MKRLIGVAVSVFCTVCVGEQVKEVTIHFDPARLVMETRGNAVLFRYQDPSCKYVEQEAGAPVLPAVFFNVLMPKGAVYVHSQMKAEAQPYRGRYRVFTRTRSKRTGAQRYPRSIVEFVGCRDIDGFRVFTFRAYPVCCQPADGSVARILSATVRVKYALQAPEGLYAAVPAEVAQRIKRCVINPEDLERLTTRDAYAGGRRGGSITSSSAGQVFATHIRERSAQPTAGSSRPDVFTLMKDNLYISEENDIVYAPIRF